MRKYEEEMLAEEAAASAKPSLLQLAEVQERMDGSPPGGMDGPLPEGIELDPLPRYRAVPPFLSGMQGGRRRSRKSRNRSRKNPRRSRRQHKKRR